MAALDGPDGPGSGAHRARFGRRSAAAGAPRAIGACGVRPMKGYARSARVPIPVTGPQPEPCVTVEVRNVRVGDGSGGRGAF
ncbi:hypothetical protein FAIPA1_30083 [Frankia sp. AiPs1]